MKLTATNFLEQYPKIEKKKIQKVVDAYPTAFEDFQFYNDDDEIRETIDIFIEKINKAIADEPQKKTRKRNYTTAKGKYKVTSRRKKGEPKEDKKPKKSAQKPKNSTSTPKSAAKAEKKTDKAAKSAKSTKEKIGENPAWLATLNSFVKSFAGKTKETWRVRDFVRKIQGSFNAKLGQKTPNIDLIRDIQDKLITYANKDTKKVEIPAYADLVAKCKAAIKAKDFTVSRTVAKPEIKTTSLSGLKKKRKSKRSKK